MVVVASEAFPEVWLDQTGGLHLGELDRYFDGAAAAAAADDDHDDDDDDDRRQPNWSSTAHM